MIAEDPDQDILDALAWKEHRAQIVHGLVGVAAGALIFLATFELTTMVLAWQFQVSLDGAAVIGIAIGIWLFLKLNKGA